MERVWWVTLVYGSYEQVANPYAWRPFFGGGRLHWILMMSHQNLLKFSSLSLVYGSYEQAANPYAWQPLFGGSRLLCMDNDGHLVTRRCVVVSPCWRVVVSSYCCVVMSSSHHIIMSLCHRVIMSSCHHVIVWLCDHFIMSSSHQVFMSSCHRVIFVIWPLVPLFANDWKLLLFFDILLQYFARFDNCWYLFATFGHIY